MRTCFPSPRLANVGVCPESPGHALALARFAVAAGDRREPVTGKPSPWRRLMWAWVAGSLGVFFFLPLTVKAQETPAGAGVAVDRFEFSYGLAHPQLPPLAELNRLPVHLLRDGQVWRAPKTGAGEVLLLGSVPADSQFD